MRSGRLVAAVSVFIEPFGQTCDLRGEARLPLVLQRVDGAQQRFLERVAQVGEVETIGQFEHFDERAVDRQRSRRTGPEVDRRELAVECHDVADGAGRDVLDAADDRGGGEDEVSDDWARWASFHDFSLYSERILPSCAGGSSGKLRHRLAPARCRLHGADAVINAWNERVWVHARDAEEAV